MTHYERTVSQHKRLAAVWLVTGVGLAMVLSMVLGFGFGRDDTPAPLLAWVGSWGAAYHLYWLARLQGRRGWRYAALAALGPVPAFAVYGWLHYALDA
ncbi:hypothetical protein [Stenotrophomonas sp. 24(2023)]|uniref:hypothetical protein n=1 Tax=Stenotrophomonas sp. 24(2023) TaxID=3068324 RepID=UPI0027E191B6|nr:hypothetical protein [Stenotrophomonas sp. 24(2023)]WMJ68192.1 hypothetical protein Q9R17_13400 [Stenotrophomonas sp. 24(2023)]